MKLFLLSLMILSGAVVSAQNRLSEMTKTIRSGEYNGIHSILVAKGGHLVYEEYFQGYTSDSLHNSRSSFKSITSLLLGIALDHNLIKSVNQPVYTFFPEDVNFAADSRKKAMTIKDLLEMRSGFNCEEWTDNGKDCESAMTQSKNWVEFSLALPMKNDPGKVWSYTSCNPMIISGIISKVSGMSVMDFAAKYLFKPMGITRYRWTIDPSGQGMTAGSFFILPSDMLKIGQMILNNGLWNERRIVSGNWLSESTKGNISIPDNWSFVKSSRSKAAEPQQTLYGYYWYNEVIKIKDGVYPMVFASGNGGQYIMIIKSLNLVVVFTQGNYESWTAKKSFDLLAKYILPACR